MFTSTFFRNMTAIITTIINNCLGEVFHRHKSLRGARLRTERKLLFICKHKGSKPRESTAVKLPT